MSDQTAGRPTGVPRASGSTVAALTPMAAFVVRIAHQATIILLFIGAAVLGTVAGLVFAFAGDLPQISALDDYAPSTITRVYASRGEMVGEFAIERRDVVKYDQISPHLRQALIAAEDQGFNSHVGLSMTRIVITAVKDILSGDRAGASTLTQQLARNLFLTNEKTWERKAKEAILTIQIEKRYTKPEIITLYCNHVPWGHGRYGAEAASRLYFNKAAKDLTLEEAAMLAGIVQAPARQSPYVNPDASLRRRNYALQRMADEGFITQQVADEAKKKPIVTAGRPDDDTEAPFYVEEVRQHLEDTYGAKQLYENGLTVATALDLNLQRAAERAVDEGVRRLDHRRGFRKPHNVLAERHTLESYSSPTWKKRPVVGGIATALVTEVTPQAARIRVGAFTGELTKPNVAWTGKTTLSFLTPGDVVELRVTALDEPPGTIAGTLEQTPLIEGAALAIHNRTGQIVAMVGGSSFARSKFNRATQASRQVGSTFKAVVYTAAIDRGYTPVSILMDQPVSYPAGPGQPIYAPNNYDHTFEGPITLRRALEQSRNVPTVRLMEELRPPQVIAYAKRLGFTSPVQPYLSSALGSSEATLVEVTSAFSVFPNQGVRMQPYQVLKVTDRQGNLLEENRPEPHEAIRADTAFVMTNLLRGVVQRGTAARAAALNWPLGGKTGTTNDFTDAWFVGFDPDITLGVWIGYDRKKTLGSGQTGAAAALPIWIDIMKAYIGDRKDAPEFAPPGNIIFLNVDRQSGAQIEAGVPGAIHEAFISGTQPGGAFR